MYKMVKKSQKRDLVVGTILILIGIMIISLLYPMNFILLFVLIVLSVLTLKTRVKKGDVHLFFTAAVLGPLAEIVAIYFGAWSYTNPTFLGIPMWLPLAWGLFIVTVRRLSEALTKLV